MIEFHGARVLVTGGAGFIGSSISRRLVGLGAEVTIVDSLLPQYGGNLANLTGIESSARLNISDVRDSHGLRYLVKGKDFIFNLAGQTSHMDSMTDPYADLEINARAQLSILESIRSSGESPRIIFASTRQIYGRPRYLPVDESHPIAPVDVNGINKVAGEHYHLLYHNVYGIQSSALRLTNTYGPGMRIKDARQTFLGIWIRNVLSGQPIEVWGGDQLRDFNFVDDVVDAFLVAASSDSLAGEALNLGSTDVVSLRQLAELLVEVAGTGTYVIKEFPKERERIDIGDYYSSYSKMSEMTGWKPRVGLRDGLVETLNYYRDHLDHYL